jgi:membrane AbrB-like protein
LQFRRRALKLRRETTAFDDLVNLNGNIQKPAGSLARAPAAKEPERGFRRLPEAKAEGRDDEMGDSARIGLTLVIAMGGGFCLHRLRVPVGAFIGAMMGAILLNLTLEAAYIPLSFRVFIQMFVGMRVGAKIAKKDVYELRYMIAPMLILVVSMLLLNFIFATAIHSLGRLDVATALFASAPGGMADMAIISDELGANPVHVSVLQLTRVLFINLIISPLFRFRLKPGGEAAASKGSGSGRPAAGPSPAPAGPAPEKPLGNKAALPLKKKILYCGIMVLAGLTGGSICWKLGIKAGGLMGSMILVGALNIGKGCIYFPKQLENPLRVMTGAYVGQQLNRQGFLMMRQLLLPLLIMLVGVLVFTLVTPMIMQRFSQLDKATCMLASAPGGLTEMSMIAEDLGADTPKVVLMQSTRMVFVLLLFPNMLAAITLFLTHAVGGT